MKKAELTYSIIIFGVLLILLLATGCTGCSNMNGKNGATGAQGPQGQPGVSEPPPQVDTLPATLAQCDNGGVQIFVGSALTVICNGINGTNGTNGSDANVTFVQFCPGVTPTYPSAFPEVGICVNNVLYGVYSANGGFLTQITPGVYSSDGINASCTFTVSANCVVTQ